MAMELMGNIPLILVGKQTADYTKEEGMITSFKVRRFMNQKPQKPLF
jgi:hypothetical protein